MAATAPQLRSAEQDQPYAAGNNNGTGLLFVSALTILAVVIHGYHPYAEDGGLYLAGVKRALHPGLFPYWTGFTTAHLRFSLFAPTVAWLVRASHFKLMILMFLLYVGSIWATLYGAWHIVVRCYPRREACYGAVSLLALLLTVPVAGTSLMLMDPYVSARSISTPCGLWALVAVLDIARQVSRDRPVALGSIILCFGSLFLAALVHPLMAGYALGCVLVLATALLIGRKLQWVIYGAMGMIAVLLGALIIRFSSMPPPGYMDVARTRAYWFLAYWHSYELAGLAVPLLVLVAISFHYRNKPGDNVKSLALTGVVVGVLSSFVAALYARPAMASYAVARLQPLRAFQMVYVITILMVGAGFAAFILKRRAWRWAAMISSIGVVMLLGQLECFRTSDHIELPFVSPANGWEQAFLWVRSHTPVDAVIALDADYITAPGEDAQNFRAIAERSAIPDYSKDGGVAAIAPDLTADWIAGEAAQKGLDEASDAERLTALRATRVDWVILSRSARTSLPCEYMNHAAKVCRVPDVNAPQAGHGEFYRANALKANVAHGTDRSISRH